MDDRDLDALIDAGCAALRIPIEPEWRRTVRASLSVTLHFAALVEAHALPDEAEPAPVFRA